MSQYRRSFPFGSCIPKTPPYDPILSLQTRQQHILAITLDPGGEWLACSCLDGGLYLVPIISLTLVSHLINPRLRARVIVVGVCVCVRVSVCLSVHLSTDFLGSHGSSERETWIYYQVGGMQRLRTISVLRHLVCVCGEKMGG